MKHSIPHCRGMAIALSGLILGLALRPPGEAAPLQEDPALSRALDALLAVGPEGAGNTQGTAAWRAVSAARAEQLPQLLRALDAANPLAANWLRAATDTIADRALRQSQSLPIAGLGAFALDTRRTPQAREVAFDLIRRVDPAGCERLVPGMLNDPSPERRREAVQRLIDEGRSMASRSNEIAATLVFQQAFNHAREADQVQAISAELRRRGQTPDLPRHFGFLMNWHVIGPFDNTGRRGFADAFPPEKTIDLQASYPGKSGAVAWRSFDGKDELGVIDINQVCGALKEVTAYAYTEFQSPTAGPAELRLGCKNGWKLWFNGRFLFGRDEYHFGSEIDQYRFPVQLERGANRILVKVCQNEQTEDWTKEWEFQLRISDATGTAILAPDRPVTPAAALAGRPTPPPANP